MKLNKTRERLIEEFKNCLTEDKIFWKKGWKVDKMNNPSSGTEYHGVNRFYLNMVAVSEDYTDNRWVTFNQIKEQNYKLNNAKGKGVPIEYWSYYNLKDKKTVSIQEAKRLMEKEEYRGRF